MDSSQTHQPDFSFLYPSIVLPYHPEEEMRLVNAPRSPNSAPKPANYVIRRDWEMNRGWANSPDYRAARAEIIVHMLKIWRGSYPKSGSASISPSAAAFLREQKWINVSFSVSDILPKPARVIHTALRVLLDRFWEGHGANRYETTPARYLYLSFFPPRHYNCLQRWMWAMKNAHVNLGRPNMGPPLEVQAFAREILAYYHGGAWGIGCDCVMPTTNIYEANSDSLSRHCDHRPIEYNDEYKRLYPVEIINAICRLREQREDREQLLRMTRNSQYGAVSSGLEMAKSRDGELAMLGAMAVVVASIAVMAAAHRKVARAREAAKQTRNRKPQASKQPRNRKPRKPQPYRGRWCP